MGQVIYITSEKPHCSISIVMLILLFLVSLASSHQVRALQEKDRSSAFMRTFRTLGAKSSGALPAAGSASF